MSLSNSAPKKTPRKHVFAALKRSFRKIIQENVMFVISYSARIRIPKKRVVGENIFLFLRHMSFHCIAGSCFSQIFIKLHHTPLRCFAVSMEKRGPELPRVIA